MKTELEYKKLMKTKDKHLQTIGRKQDEINRLEKENEELEDSLATRIAEVEVHFSFIDENGLMEKFDDWLVTKEWSVKIQKKQLHNCVKLR
jgi:hypothetical protein